MKRARKPARRKPAGAGSRKPAGAGSRKPEAGEPRFGDQLIRVYGDMAINSGYYTFSYVKDGETKTIPARYSFVYVKGTTGWLIVDHHSSAMPAPPK